ncbi:MAG: radical SAM protein [Candidatus Omnitrophota bacterium]|nr:radical SAM protein [Candidatus Omnitrophota bacterium]
MDNVIISPDSRIHIKTSGCCNNNCIFCCDRDCINGQNMLSKYYCSVNGEPFLNLDMFKRDGRKTKEVDSISFTGGESTLNKGLLYFIRLSKKWGYKDICLQTNGRLLRYKNFCIELLDSGLNEINISLHGSNKKIHDALTRSSGAFEQTWQGLCNMVSLKEKYRFRLNVNFTMTKINYRDIENFLRKILPFNKVDSIVLNMPMYSGNAERFFSQLFVTYLDVAKEVRNVIDRLKVDKLFRLSGVIQISPVPLCLMVGYENYVGESEIPLQVKNKRVEILPRESRNIKNKSCKPCKYYYKCSGIDNLYAEKVGWGEFRAIK